MRVLFTSTPAVGHFHPLVPIAQALEAAGHLVAFASLPSFASVVEASGFRFFPVGPHISDLYTMPELREYVSLSDPIARREMVRQHLTPVLLPRLTLPDLLAWCESWSPDLIINDNYQFASRVAAERFDIPHVTLKVGDTFGYATRQQLVPAMDALRSSVGLSPDPDAEMLFRFLYLLNEPESFQIEQEELPPTTLRCRRVVFDQSGKEERPEWLAALPPVPTVCATAGTTVNKTPGLLESFLDALRDEPINVILTIGRDRDPDDFASHAANVHVERYIPLSMVLPACDLLLSHCGSGTMYAAMDHGLPMVNVPIGMDQPENADRCARLKLGLTIDASVRTPASIRAAVRQVLGDPGFRTNAQRLQRDMHALPLPGEVVPILECLARDKRHASEQRGPRLRSF
jgi:UDP:flavonoid glycosyltransferase YjiC (YdhE family)